MQTLILDTNVLVSALIQKSFPYKIVNELFIENKVHLCISGTLMAEYYEVLRRPKFSSYPDFVARAEILLADIESKLSQAIQTTLHFLFTKTHRF